MLQPHALHIIALVVVRRAQVYHQAFLIVLMQDYLRLFLSLYRLLLVIWMIQIYSQSSQSTFWFNQRQMLLVSFQNKKDFFRFL